MNAPATVAAPAAAVLVPGRHVDLEFCKRVEMMSYRLVLLCLVYVSMLAACQSGANEEVAAANPATHTALAAHSEAGAADGGDGECVAALSDVSVAEDGECTGSVGDSAYCDSCECGYGEGDCDGDSECAPGLYCYKDVGADFGYASDVDVCLGECEDYSGHWEASCTSECPCEAGEGDCDTDADCAEGYRCMHDTGALYGMDPELDTCELLCSSVGLGTTTFCSSECLCDAGEGDCDSDSDCLPGLRCARDVGARYGFDPETDVCEGISTCDLTDGAGDEPALAYPLSFDYVNSWAAGLRMDKGFLCSGEDDWYRFPNSAAGFTPVFLAVRAEARGADYCGPGCDGLTLPDAPENSITIEVYDESMNTLLSTRSDTDGTLFFDVSLEGMEYTDDLLIHVTGAAEATYPYELTLWVQPFDGEDECEC